MKSNKYEAIILAAGFSKRAEKYKMLLPLGEKTIIKMTVENMLKVCHRVIVVTGHNRQLIEKELQNISRAELLFNEDFELGMFSSVQKGVSKIDGERFFLIPGDQPLVKRETLKKMLEIEAEIVSPRCRGKKGHPVLFKNHLKEGILGMSKDGILRDFIHKIGSECVDVDDMGIHLDVDTMEDYKIILNYISKRNSRGGNEN